MGIYKYYEKGSPTVKVLIVGGAITACIAAYFGIINPLRKLIIKKLDESKTSKEGKEASKVLDELKDKGVTPSINDAQAEGFVNTLVAAFNGCGTDEDAIYGVMSQLKNDADWYKLQTKFAVREYDECGWGKTSKTLSAALSDELDLWEKSIINRGFEKAGLTVRVS